MYRTFSRIAAGMTLALLTVTAANAEVVRFEISRTVPAFGGQSFGDTGAYELVEGTAYFEIDPDLPVNALIANLQRAPRNERGLVEMDADVVILRPADPARGNGHLFYEPVNRGSILSLGAFNGGARGVPLTDARAGGDGFLMRQGYTLVYSGWQPTYPIADAPAMSIGGGSRLPPGPALQARLPVATNADGSPITQRITAGIGAGPNRPSQRPGEPVTVYLTYPAADVTDAGAFVRNSVTGERVAGATWRYVDEWRAEVTLPANAGGPLELVYVAKDPVVYGLSLVSMRDLVSFLRYGGEGNPMAYDGRSAITATFGYGASQTGRTLKNLLYHFNDDEAGRIVFDGANIHISGASLNSQNVVFGQPGMKGGEDFPYTYATLFDPLSRRTDGWLMRCAATNTCPKIFHTDSDAELTLAGSLVYTDIAGNDVDVPDNVRVYLLSSTQHSPAGVPSRGRCLNLSNPMPYRQPMRALLVALDDWVTEGLAPPESRHPRRADMTLVTEAEARAMFPAIPGFTFGAPFTPMYRTDPASGEPIPGMEYPLYRPATDEDGNTAAGIRHPMIAAPLGTYTGWNPSPAGDLCPATGSYAPFPATRAERLDSGDPRLSIEERYASETVYLGAVSAAAQRLVNERLMLADDVEDVLGAAAEAYREATDAR